MATVTAPHATAVAPWVGERIAGLCGIGFAVLIILQNILRGAAAPPNDAPAGEILDYARSANPVILLALFPVGGVLLLGFVAGLYRRLRTDAETAGIWATLGLLGGALTAAVFAVSNGFLAVLAASADSLDASPAVAETLWQLHAAVFGLNMLGIGLALFGLSRAAGSVLLIPRWRAVASQAGAVLLIAAAGTSVQQVQASPVFFIGLPGFVVWVVFLTVTGTRPLRAAPR